VVTALVNNILRTKGIEATGALQNLDNLLPGNVEIDLIAMVTASAGLGRDHDGTGNIEISQMVGAQQDDSTVVLVFTSFFIMHRDFKERLSDYQLIRPSPEEPIAVLSPNSLAICFCSSS